MRERDVINLISSILGISQHDDCVLFDNGEEYITACCDMLTEKTDFPRGMTPYQIGWMSIAVGLSDIAAMGAKPMGVLWALHLPKGTSQSFISELARGAGECASYAGTRVLGGDVGIQDELTVCTVSIGMVKKEYCAKRDGAKVGDLVGITGELGVAPCGLRIFLTGASERCERYANEMVSKALMPIPRVFEGMEIAKHCSSMMDISDGLAVSLYEIGRRSGVGFEIDRDKLPVPEGVWICMGEDTLDTVLYGAGDFELLFTASEDEMSKISSLLDITVIGRTIEGEGVVFDTGEKIEDKGWEAVI